MNDKQIKCVVWDLDNTLWEGVLVEGGGQVLKPYAAELVRKFDDWGVLQSVVSRNDPQLALARLRQFGLEEYFLHPQISWDFKSAAVSTIIGALNISANTVVFIDDSPFERAEVLDGVPEIRAFDPAALPELLDRSELWPTEVTDEARRRRELYHVQSVRQTHEEQFVGSRATFLAELGMRLTLKRAAAEDLARVSELTVRTNQLNTTGLTFSRDELVRLLGDPGRLLLVAELTDRFGGYGTIGLVLVDTGAEEWRIRLFLMSCRVMGRNVGGAILAWLAERAEERGVSVTADFRATGVNRPMFVVYRMAGFRHVAASGPTRLLRLVGRPPRPGFIELRTEALEAMSS